MAVDEVEWDEAILTLKHMHDMNSAGVLKRFGLLPYRVALFSATFGGAASFPLCFHYPTVHWFNDRFVTADVPEAKDLETWLEVGSWAWNWMEPPLGQLSFFILCCQVARNQFSNLGITPYTSYLKNARAARLCQSFSKYNARVVSDFALTDSWRHTDFSFNELPQLNGDSGNSKNKDGGGDKKAAASSAV